MARTRTQEAPAATLPEPTPAPESPKRKCEIGKVLGKTINQLLIDYPGNPSVRAQVLNLIGKQIPPELLAYDNIKEWFEYNVEPAKLKHPQGPGIMVEANYSYIEYGTCNYSNHWRGSGEVSIDYGTLAELVANEVEGGGNVDSLVEVVERHLKTDAEGLETDSDNGPQHDNYDQTDSGDHKCEFQASIEELVRYWLESNDPEALENLEM